jgi:hypothetical protein
MSKHARGVSTEPQPVLLSLFTAPDDHQVQQPEKAQCMARPKGRTLKMMADLLTCSLLN